MRHVIEVFLLIILFSCILTFTVFSAVLTVPGDYPTIQQAIDAASEGDEIIVSPRTYVENIEFKGINITLRSVEPTSETVRAATVIDGDNADSVVTFSGTENETCILAGFSIINGLSLYEGGGILGNGCLATLQYNTISDNIADYGGGICLCNGLIKDNTIMNNAAMQFGGGIYRCAGLIENNTITDNVAYSDGGGLNYCHNTIRNNYIAYNTATLNGGGIHDSDGTIYDNIISYNSAGAYGGGFKSCHGIIRNNTISNNSSGGQGGGFYDCNGRILNNIISGNVAITTGGGISWCFGSTIQNNIISANSAVSGGGISYCNMLIQNNTIVYNSGGGIYPDLGIIRNCIIWHNTPYQIAGGAQPLYSCIQNWTGGGMGNISLEPQLVDVAGGDFHLKPTSPCIDAGWHRGVSNFDIDGEPRIMDVPTIDNNGGLDDIDIGADEYTVSPLPPTPMPQEHYTFDSDAEGWQFQGHIPPFSGSVYSTSVEGHIGLSAYNSFSYWYSPDVEIDDDSLYRTRWNVGTSCLYEDRSPQCRLRITQKGSWQTWSRIITSNNMQGPTLEYDWYNLIFKPDVTRTNDSIVVFCFDIMSFDVNDDWNSWQYLDEFVLEKTEIAGAEEVVRYDYPSGAEGWQFAGLIPPYDKPLSTSTGGHLGMSPDWSCSSFSYWSSPDVSIEDGAMYRARFEISSSVTEPDDALEFRLRVNQRGAWQGWERMVPSYNQQGPSSSEWKTYDIYLNLEITGYAIPSGADDTSLIFSFDMMNFDSDDAWDSWLYLESMTLEEIVPSP